MRFRLLLVSQIIFLSGSVKSNASCTAYMNVNTNMKTGHISVVVCFDHYGHSVEMKSVRIPREDRWRLKSVLKVVFGCQLDHAVSG